MSVVWLFLHYGYNQLKSRTGSVQRLGDWVKPVDRSPSVFSAFFDDRLVCVPGETSPHLLLRVQDQQLGAEQDQLPCWSAGTSSGNCQETETCMVWACHTPRQPLKNHPSEHPGVWAWSAEMLGRQHQRMDIPADVRTGHKGLLQKKTGRGSLLNHPSCPPDGDTVGQGTELN